MFFSESTWSSEEVNTIMPTSSALSFEKIESSLHSADDMFIIPLIGNDMMNVAHAILNKKAWDRTEKEQRLLRLLQTAELNLAMFYDFQELNLRISDQGFQRQTTDNFTAAYKYQEDNLRQSFRNKGLNALDMVIDLLETSTTDWSEYYSSPAYHDMRVRVVKNAKEVNSVVYINNSQLVFKRMIPLIKEVEDTQLPTILGDKVNTRLRTAMALGHQDETIGDTTIEELRQRCIPYIVFKAAAQLVRQTGSLTDRGLYFTETSASGGNDTTTTPANSEQAAIIALNYEQSAARYLSFLTTFMEYSLPELFAGHESDVLKRDNNGKRTVWL